MADLQKIIIADDDPILRALLARNLQTFGFKIIEIPDGTDLVQLVGEHKPVACFVDMVMPLKEGAETLLELFLKYGSDRPKVCAISGNLRFLEFLSRELTDCVLKKPFSTSDIRQTLATLELLPLA